MKLSQPRESLSAFTPFSPAVKHGVNAGHPSPPWAQPLQRFSIKGKNGLACICVFLSTPLHPTGNNLCGLLM